MRTKLIIVTVLALLLVIFAVQNTEEIGVKLWFWQLNMARAILIFVSFAIGLIIGLLLPTLSGKKPKKDKNMEAIKEEKREEQHVEKQYRAPGEKF